MDASTPKFAGSAPTKQTVPRVDGAAVRGDSSDKAGRSLWLWVAALFVFGTLLWVAMFTAARHVDTREVPLAPKGARP